MSEPTGPSLSEATVRSLVDLAGLPLPPERAALLAAPLGVWVAWADELNRKMSDARHWTVTPITAFARPPATGGEQP